jgi:hypothetical protein
MAALPSCSSPLKGEARRGMGLVSTEFKPIPTPALPLKGRERRVMLYYLMNTARTR